jgi:3-hydroxybutyryl-CoA dehydratase
MIGVTIERIEVGDRAEVTRVATDGDIAGFVDAVGDYNPIHSDPAYAAGTLFKERIAPGIWTAGLISAVIGTRLPGRAPSISPRTSVPPAGQAGRHHHRAGGSDRDHPGKNRVRLRTVCVNQRARTCSAARRW